MNDTTIQTAVDHALADYPRESCGLVVVVRGKERYVPCKNVASNPLEEFAISGQEFAEAQDQGEILAVVHSHPNCGPSPSQADKVQCEEYGVPWYIIAVNTVKGDRACEIAKIEPSGYKAPLIGRKWHHGVLDCYALCRDWYKQEMGLDLPDYPREDLWWEKGQNLYLDHFEEAGFVVVAKKELARIDTSQLQVGDGLLMQIRSPVINHAAVYIGDGMMIHHQMGRLSSRDYFLGHFQEATQLIVRYKE